MQTLFTQCTLLENTEGGIAGITNLGLLTQYELLFPELFWVNFFVVVINIIY